MGHKPSNPALTFARAVNKEIRAEMGKSDEYRSNRALAEALDKSGDYVNQRINGLRPWDLTDLEMIARLFNVHPGDLVDGALAAIEAAETANVVDIRSRKSSHGRPSLDYLRGLPSTGEPERRDDSNDDDGEPST